MEVELAIVGGSGVSEVVAEPVPHELSTDHGTVTVRVGELAGRTVAFLPRHGADHDLPPHRIDYRANVAALGQVTDRVIATAAVGGVDPALEVGSFVLVDQFLDFTHGRQATFFDEEVAHVDVSDPYCSQLRGLLARAASSGGLACAEAGTYVCTQGPRFETAAEIEAFRRLGGDVVGMTGVPEVVLARELGLCYATVASVTNPAAGLSARRLSHEEVMEAQAAGAERLRGLLAATIGTLPAERGCGCGPPPEPV